MRAMRINTRKKECANASDRPFTMFSHCVYGYNIRNELVSATKNSEYTEYQYQYDDIGNRLTSLDLGTNRTYTANNLNQYTSISNSAASALSAGEFVPQFDDDMRPRQRRRVARRSEATEPRSGRKRPRNQTLIQTATGIWQVQYNGENRPILWQCVSTNSLTPNSSTPSLISMSYDRMGRRVTKNNQRFVYDGYLCIGKIEDSTSIHYPLSPIHCFIWDPTEPIATRPLAWLVLRSLGEGGYYTHDGNKNVSEVIEENGDIAAHYEYTPFGALITSRGMSAAANPWRFSSEYAENETETVYYNYRHYEPSVGIWLSRDPYKEEEDTFFVNNDPIGLLDWLGLDSERSTCVSISHSKNFDFRNKPLGKYGLFKFKGTLASGYSLKGEACLKCCKTGANAGIKKLSGSGEVSLLGRGTLTATYGVDFKSNLFWDFYRLYLFGGVQVSVSLSGSGTGSFEFDGCDGAGTLNVSLSDSIELAVRGGVEGRLKRRGGRRNGNWHYNTVAKVAALIKISVSSSLSTTLSCDTEKCVLTSSIGGFDANIGAEFTFKRKTLSLDIWRFHGDGVVLAETEFESPLKGWAEQ